MHMIMHNTEVSQFFILRILHVTFAVPSLGKILTILGLFRDRSAMDWKR